eukprot:g4980.t1
MLREELKHEQRIRKDEIHLKLRELAARPVRPEERQSINDLRQSVMSVRDECSKLRAECRRLSSEVVARDSEVLSRVLGQLSDMKNLLDTGMEDVTQLPIGLGGEKGPRGFARAKSGPGEKPTSRSSPPRERSLQVRSMSAKKLTRGPSKTDVKAAIQSSPEDKAKEIPAKVSARKNEAWRGTAHALQVQSNLPGQGMGTKSSKA